MRDLNGGGVGQVVWVETVSSHDVRVRGGGLRLTVGAQMGESVEFVGGYS